MPPHREEEHFDGAPERPAGMRRREVRFGCLVPFLFCFVLFCDIVFRVFVMSTENVL